mgnify:CR=1 FL=1
MHESAVGVLSLRHECLTTENICFSPQNAKKSFRGNPKNQLFQGK